MHAPITQSTFASEVPVHASTSWPTPRCHQLVGLKRASRVNHSHATCAAVGNLRATHCCLPSWPIICGLASTSPWRSTAASMRETKVLSSSRSLLRMKTHSPVAAATPEFTALPKPPFTGRRTTVTPSTSGKGVGETSSETTISISAGSIPC